MRRLPGSPFFAGMLVANSAPHLATAVTGRRHMTPLAGRRSGPVVNGVWAGLNLAAGLLLLRRARRGDRERWDRDLVSFEAGYLTFALWMAGTERLVRMNWDRAATDE
ncbi:hypothetical protein Acsp03_01160 [Actinomadura sp. NBRC 104412]|uniref:hypothetical protein n=1 Tax=Actinomadura sp. NBRC 104412 TaxID=3032203 RepID=UPI0024A4F9BB|nr:hypothetical protein [Actinomadura sp. NBRC 104412]GLZ02649.1 hypothetical protein Acsp03_01160 [Actinomadura sp. NBRC 104412]